MGIYQHYNPSEVEAYGFKPFHIAKIFKMMNKKFTGSYIHPDNFYSSIKDVKYSWTICNDGKVIYSIHGYIGKIIRYNNHLFFQHLASKCVLETGSIIILK